MKRTVALLLTFSLLFCFVACKKKLPLNEINSSTASRTAVTKDTTIATTLEATAKEEKKTEIITVKETKATQTTQTIRSETTTEAPTTTESKKICTVTINCSQILNNQEKLKTEKAAFVPADGYILNSATVEFVEGESVFDVFRKACNGNVCTENCDYCKSGGIHYEASYSAGYDNYYIEGIHQIYEKDCGSKSGWMYRVNGDFPNYGCSSYTVKNGDAIEFLYTCNLGEDIGNTV